MRDFDRPLDASGRLDAEATGAAMLAAGYVPDLVLCSGAARARETLDGVILHITPGKVIHTNTLYSSDGGEYVATIRDAPDAETMLVVGHNPMMEDVAMALAGDGDEAARHVLNAGFPTSGLAVIRFSGKLREAAPGTGYLEAFLVPAER